MTYPNGRVLYYNYDGSTLDASISRLSNLSGNSTSSSAAIERYTYLGADTLVQRTFDEPGTHWSLTRKLTAADTWVDPFNQSESAHNKLDAYTGLDNHGRIRSVRYDTLNTSGYVAGQADHFNYAYDKSGNRLYRENALNHSFDELYHADGAAGGYDELDRLASFQRGTMTDANGDGVLDTTSTSGHDTGDAIRFNFFVV